MSVDTMFRKAICIRLFWLVLAVASLLGASAVQSQTVSADFGGRNGATPVIPSGLFSVGGTGSSLQNRNAISTLTTAGLNEARFWISLQQIYATSTPNFSQLDWALQTMQSTGVRPLGVIYGTPPSLGSGFCAPPSDVGRWGQMAASVVAHVNRNYPGLMRDYEIWNEPELASSLCVADDTARLNTYISMFAAAGSAMHAQAQSDGQPIRTGGPGISRVKELAQVWVTALVSNSSSAPYADFVSFHFYPSGMYDIQHGMNWSTLYATTQSATLGPAYYYKKTEPLVRQGHQPNAGSTPIYITEYNANWAYAVDCCRNNPTYGPLWNSLVITDLLNVVYSGATTVPSQLSYFYASEKYFCLLGQWNASMDCNTAALDPYPQFYAYKLFASPEYLDLQKGGHMAVSVSPASTTSGLAATAFYTSAADSAVIINPTSTDYNAINVLLKNPGLTSATGTAYLLDRANGQISSQSVALTPMSGGYTAQVAVPAYSTVAISVKGSQGGGGGGSAPTAVLNVTPQTGTQPVTVIADSSQSDGGGESIVGRTIDFGDGYWKSWQPTVSHTYTKAGSYKIRLTIKNQSGQISTANTVVTVGGGSGGSAPKAVLTVTLQTGTHPVTITADSSQSLDGGEPIVGRTIDFGDGYWKSWQATVSHTYTKAGSYKVLLTIKNQSGQISTANTIVTIQ